MARAEVERADMTRLRLWLARLLLPNGMMVAKSPAYPEHLVHEITGEGFIRIKRRCYDGTQNP